MKPFCTLIGCLTLASACSGTPAALASSQLATDSAGKPVATSGASAGPSVGPSANTDAVPASAAYREVTLPAGTILPIDLETTVGSDISRVEQPVSGRLRRAVTVGGAEVLAAGTAVSGHVTTAQRPGKVKGRGLIAIRFTRLDTPGAGTTPITTGTISRIAPATKQKDTLQVVAPAAAGAVIGRIAGGKSGAAKGAVIGGGAGAGYVLATRGKDVHITKGTDLAVKLTAPVTVRVPVR
jgi:hypothetical protein